MMRMLNKKDLKEELCSKITKAEWDALECGEGVYINSFNRSVMLRMRDAEVRAEGKLPRDSIDELTDDLSAYLKQYMADHPEGHKWIIFACLYLTFIEGLPMHPKSSAGWVEQGGKYYCIHKVEDSLTCGYCVCEKGLPPSEVS